jgi:hypothetical protein
MKIPPPPSVLVLIPALLISGNPAPAYPPAPYHRVYGSVRDDLGNPLDTSDGIVVLSAADNKEVVRGPTDPRLGAGINYSLPVPLDAGIAEELYAATALKPQWPFTIRVIRGTTSYVPIQMQGGAYQIGQPAQSTRIDLTLGIDSDGDGLPDAWERELMRSDPRRRHQNISEVLPGDDSDGDGLTNLEEYIAGTYALDARDGLSIDIVEVSHGIARLQFLAVAKRTYRLKSSATLEEFSAQPFSLAASGLDPVQDFRAVQTELRSVYVPVGEAPLLNFRLYVE